MKLLCALIPGSCPLCGETMHHESERGQIVICAACMDEIAWIRGRLCPICGKPLLSERDNCLACRERTYHFDSHRSLFLYRGRGHDLLRFYKFRRCRSLSSLFVTLSLPVIGSISRECPRPVLVPVPSSRDRDRARGWNAVDEFARRLETRGFAVSRLLEKRRGHDQKGLGYDERRENLKGRILLSADMARKVEYPGGGNGNPGGSFILVDDVFTTGATLSECALALKNAGATRVDALTLAFTP